MMKDDALQAGKYLLSSCRKGPAIELMNDESLDGGIKSCPRGDISTSASRRRSSCARPEAAALSGTRRAAAKAS